MSREDVPSMPLEAQSETAVDTHNNARALVRLIQCSQCSFPLRYPVTLPCGNSLCRQCLPPTHLREHITYPRLATRQAGITCPFAGCGKDHPLDDCSVNVALTKFMEDLEQIIVDYQSQIDATPEICMQENLALSSSSEEVAQTDAATREKGTTMVASGGRFVATYMFAKSGGLPYLSEVDYSNTDGHPDVPTPIDDAIGENLKDVSKRQMECHICYSLMLDPTSTPCGHTWCRKCLARVLDHSRLCATCRRVLFLPSALSRHPANKCLVDLLENILPDQLAARKAVDEEEETRGPGGSSTPLFVCTTSFPAMPVFLHIFEPRYRLMIRRALEANGQFGMLTYNDRQGPQGDLGNVSFMQCGTMLHISRYRVLPDGRSFIECQGLYRFRVVSHGQLDGYTVGNVERLEDIGIAEEEAAEAAETTQPPPANPEDIDAQLDRMSTQDLHQIGMRFVARARQQSAHWLQQQVIEAYGDAPDDPAVFPYWFASVLPMRDHEKYLLMPTTSIRERLKITARWIRRIEAQPWYSQSACLLL